MDMEEIRDTGEIAFWPHKNQETKGKNKEY